MKKLIRIGTRGSKLALYQAYKVKEALEAKHQEHSFEIVVIKTKGDKILDVPLSKIGDKGLFTKELEVAMFNNEIDMAVHSLKDLPTIFPEGTCLGAVLKRATPFDVLVSKDGRKLSELNSTDVVATSSLRRKAQLLRINKNLKIVEIRGNINTRIRKLQEGHCDAMVLAAAGLQRLDMHEHISEIIEPQTVIPACGQGAIAIEIKDNDQAIAELVSTINDEETMITTDAERTFLNTLEGGCQIPVGSYSTLNNESFTITGFISNLDGSIFLKETATGSKNDAKKIAERLALSLSKQGGKKILDDIKRTHNPLNKSFSLAGKTFISTRAFDPNDELKRLIEEKGGLVLSMPMINIVETNLSKEEHNSIKYLNEYNWLFFTSKNGVIHFFQKLIEINGNTLLPPTLKIATIGEKTAEELDYYGYSPTFNSSGNTSAEFAKEFIKQHAPVDQKILLVLGKLAGTNLLEYFENENKVTRLNIYDTQKPDIHDKKIVDQILKGQYESIIFTSPSTFNNFCASFGEKLPNNLHITSIGATTSKAIELKGFKAQITARVSNSKGISDSIQEYFINKK